MIRGVDICAFHSDVVYEHAVSYCSIVVVAMKVVLLVPFPPGSSELAPAHASHDCPSCSPPDLHLHHPITILAFTLSIYSIYILFTMHRFSTLVSSSLARRTPSALVTGSKGSSSSGYVLAARRHKSDVPGGQQAAHDVGIDSNPAPQGKSHKDAKEGHAQAEPLSEGVRRNRSDQRDWQSFVC